ncbi:MAG TPA: phage tail tube protein [Sphingomonas sp.]
MATDPNRLAGTAFITINGVSFSISGEANYRPSGSNRETLKGPDGVHGFKEMPFEGRISFKGRDSNAVQIGLLNEATNQTVVLVLANGKTIIGRNMWRVGDPIEVATEDATFTVEFEGPDVKES